MLTALHMYVDVLPARLVGSPLICTRYWLLLPYRPGHIGATSLSRVRRLVLPPQSTSGFFLQLLPQFNFIFALFSRPASLCPQTHPGLPLRACERPTSVAHPALVRLPLKHYECKEAFLPPILCPVTLTSLTQSFAAQWTPFLVCICLLVLDSQCQRSRDLRPGSF